MAQMSDTEIVEHYRRDGYVVVDDVVEDPDLDPMRDFIAAAVDRYASEQHARGELASLHADEPFERRYAAICEEQGISPRDWGLGLFGPEFYGLYTHPGILRVVGLLLGEEVSVIASPSLRQKLPGSEVTSFPWHQDSHYFDQTETGQDGEAHRGPAHGVGVGAAGAGDGRERLLLGDPGQPPVGPAGCDAGRGPQRPDRARTSRPGAHRCRSRWRWVGRCSSPT